MAEKNIIFLKFEDAEFGHIIKDLNVVNSHNVKNVPRFYNVMEDPQKVYTFTFQSVHNIDLIKRKFGEGDSLHNTK